MKMDSPKVSRMWVELQKATSKLHDSSILSSCEAEVQELMRQIDIMVDTRKQEWRKEKRMLQSKLDVREQELIIQKATLSQKHNEISQLRLSLDNMEQSQREVRVKYETDLSNLREQVAQMKRDYDKLQRRYLKHSRDKRRDSADESEAKQLVVKLEDYRQRSVDWEHERRQFQQQIDSLQSQNQILADKCDLVAQTSADIKSQLGRRRDLLTSTEQGLTSQVTQLSGMLDRAKDTVNSQDIQLSRLKAALDDSCSAQRRALQEKEQIEFELRDSQQRIMKMEDEAMELRLNCETQHKLVLSFQDEQAKTSQRMLQLQLAVQERDSLIQSLQKQNKSPDSDHNLGKLHSALSQAKSDIKTFQKTEHELREEVKRLQTDLRSVVTDRDHLNTELTKRTSDDRRSKSDSNSIYNQLKNEINKLQHDLAAARQRHDSECIEWRHLEEQLRRDITTMNSLVGDQKTKITELERLVDEQSGKMDELKVELDVVGAQLHASRVENRHLRRVASPITVAENQLDELQTAYQQSLQSLERCNSLLKEDVCRLTRELGSLRQHDVKRLELEKRIAELEQELVDRERKLRNLGRANEVMTNFVSGVDNIVQSSPRQRSTCDSSAISSRSGQLPSCSQSSSTVIVGDTELLLLEQNDLTHQLEDILSHHIDDLRAMTDVTLSKYIVSYSANTTPCNTDC